MDILKSAGREAGYDAAKTLATAAVDAVQKAEEGAADAVSCIVGAFDRLQMTVAKESPAWRASLDGLTAQATRLVDWVTGFEFHISNKKGNA